MKDFIRNSLNELYAEFSEWFNLAEYPDIEEQLRPSELSVFLKGAGAPIDLDFSSIKDYDCFSGLSAVIRHRLDQQSLEQIKLAAGLFNWTVDFGLSLCDERACAVVQVGCTETVAPFLLDRILIRFPDDRKNLELLYEGRLGRIEQRFLPVAPVVRMLRDAVGAPGWTRDDLALRLFCWITDVYKEEVENEAG